MAWELAIFGDDGYDLRHPPSEYGPDCIPTPLPELPKVLEVHPEDRICENCRAPKGHEHVFPTLCQMCLDHEEFIWT
jgi:hypothetical protein